MSKIELIKKAIQTKKVSEKEVFNYYLENALKTKNLNAFISMCDNFSESDEGILKGIPFAIKDNLSTKAIKTTCASAILKDYTPFFDAFCVSALKKEGGIIIGKTNMDEFGMGSRGENSFFGPVKNPLDQARCSGGSSSGSAVSVSSDSSVFALGSDTGGSVRLPASYCSCVGFVPTYSSVSRYGLIAYASSLDRVGILSASVRDSAIVYNIISRYDPKDMTLNKTSNSVSLSSLENNSGEIKVAFLESSLSLCDEDVIKNTKNALNLLSSFGVKIVPININFMKEALFAYSIIAYTEAVSNLLRYDGLRYGKNSAEPSFIDTYYINERSLSFGKEVKKRLLFGTQILSGGNYEKYLSYAINVKNHLEKELEKAFAEADIIICPTASSVAPLLQSEKNDKEDIFTCFSSLTGNPSISVPTNPSDSLPTALQIIGKKNDEQSVFKVASLLEKILGECEKEENKWILNL